MGATNEFVPKAGLPPSGLVVPLFQGPRWILTSAPALMASHSSRRRCLWNFSPGSAQYQFTDPQATNQARRFYRVRSG